MRFCDLSEAREQNISWRYRRKFVESQNAIIARVEALKGSAILPHSHENEEVVLVLKGVWRFDVRGEDATVRENQMLVIPPGVEHSAVALEDVVAIAIGAPPRQDWLTVEDQALDYDEDQFLWAV